MAHKIATSHKGVMVFLLLPTPNSLNVPSSLNTVRGFTQYTNSMKRRKSAMDPGTTCMLCKSHHSIFFNKKVQPAMTVAMRSNCVFPTS